MTLIRRAASVFLGLVLTLLGPVLFMMMCGSNVHIAGAFLGGIGGAVIGLRRRVQRVRWYATAGGVVLAAIGAGLEQLSTGSCAGALAAIGAGVFMGLGIGVVVDGVRGPAKPATESP